MADTRILLVDDEKEVTALLAKRLVRRGYQCDTAADGLQAVEAMREQPFPIVVMDVKMPNMDGIAALKIIVEQWPTAQVILLSGPSSRLCMAASSILNRSSSKSTGFIR